MGFFLLLSKSSKLIILNCQSVLNSVSVKLTLCYFTHVSYISLEKKSASITDKARVLIFNTISSHMYLKLHQQDCCLAPDGRIVPVSDR